MLVPVPRLSAGESFSGGLGKGESNNKENAFKKENCVKKRTENSQKLFEDFHKYSFNQPIFIYCFDNNI
jgi:hypothetical protein